MKERVFAWKDRKKVIPYMKYFFSSISRSRNQIHIGVCSVFSNRNVSVVGKSQELPCYNFDFCIAAFNEFIRCFHNFFPNFVNEFFSVEKNGRFRVQNWWNYLKLYWVKMGKLLQNNLYFAIQVLQPIAYRALSESYRLVSIAIFKGNQLF